MKTGQSAGLKGETKSISTHKTLHALGKSGRANCGQDISDSAMWMCTRYGWRSVAWLNADSETVAEIEPPFSTFRLSCDKMARILHERVAEA
jgi:hypothetical protein